MMDGRMGGRINGFSKWTHILELVLDGWMINRWIDEFYKLILKGKSGVYICKKTHFYMHIIHTHYFTDEVTQCKDKRKCKTSVFGTMWFRSETFQSYVGSGLFFRPRSWIERHSSFWNVLRTCVLSLNVCSTLGHYVRSHLYILVLPACSNELKLDIMLWK